jgi:NAD(P)-dependent dehydrogenase (short-subunit alcohol dehydrogenase family)
MSRVVLITGGAGGMGRATAERFLADGERVWLSDVDPVRLDAAVEALSPRGEVHAVPADVTVVADCERMVEEAVAAGGGLDVLVCAAGVWVEGPTVEMTEEGWDRTVGVNLKGLFFSCRYAIPHLVRSKGCIVNISSDAGLVGTPETAIYCASKGGVNNLTRSLAHELAPTGVRVNAVCPNDVETPMLEFQAERYGGGDREGYLRALLENYPTAPNARFIRPEEVAELIWFLASPKVAPITGACVPIDWAATAGY